MNKVVQTSYLGLSRLMQAWVVSLILNLAAFIILTELLNKEIAIFISWFSSAIISICAGIMMVKSAPDSGFNFWDYLLCFCALISFGFSIVGILFVSNWYIPIAVISLLFSGILLVLYLENSSNQLVKNRYLLLHFFNLVVIILLAWLRL